MKSVPLRLSRGQKSSRWDRYTVIDTLRGINRPIKTPNGPNKVKFLGHNWKSPTQKREKVASISENATSPSNLNTVYFLCRLFQALPLSLPLTFWTVYFRTVLFQTHSYDTLSRAIKIIYRRPYKYQKYQFWYSLSAYQVWWPWQNVDDVDSCIFVRKGRNRFLLKKLRRDFKIIQYWYFQLLN